MEPCLSKKLTRNFEFIEHNIIRLVKVIDKLVLDGHLDNGDKTEILSGRSREKEVTLLLEKLIKKGGSSFTSFIEALKTTGNERVADQILQTDSSDEAETLLQQRESTFLSDATNSSDFREDEILNLYKEKQMYKVKLSDMTTSFKQLQAELSIKEHKIETLANEIQKLQKDLEENRQDMLQGDGSVTDGDIFRRMNTGANTKESMRKIRDLQFALDEKEETVAALEKDLKYYKEQLDVTEKQVKKQRDEKEEKDARIMILRNQVGKLQNYLQASRQNLNRITTEQKRMMEQWNKEQLERFKDIEDKMESGKKDQSKSFTTLEDKIDILIKIVSGNSPMPNIKNTEKNKPQPKTQTFSRKGKLSRYKN